VTTPDQAVSDPQAPAAAPPAAGSGNGPRLNGGSSGYTTVDAILAKQLAETTVIAKAEADPHSLTEEDLLVLPGDVTSKLMSAGQLAHLGLGRRRHGRRH
jgi:hypothetical protein